MQKSMGDWCLLSLWGHPWSKRRGWRAPTEATGSSSDGAGKHPQRHRWVASAAGMALSGGHVPRHAPPTSCLCRDLKSSSGGHCCHPPYEKHHCPFAGMVYVMWDLVRSPCPQVCQGGNVNIPIEMAERAEGWCYARENNVLPNKV